MRQRIVSGRGGPIVFVPPEAVLLGPPSSATVTIKTSRGGDLPTPVVAAPASVDVDELQLTDDVEAGALALPVSGAQALRAGGRYLLAGDGGLRTVVRVLAADVEHAYLLAGVPAAVRSGRLTGIELRYAVAAENAIRHAPSRSRSFGAAPVDPGLHRAEWTYVVEGATHTRDSLFSVVPRLLSPTLQAEELAPYLPQEAAKLARPGDAPAFYAVLSAAWDEVLDDLEARGIRPDRVMDADRLRIPHLYRTLALMSAGWGARHQEWSAAQLAAYGQRLEAAVASTGWIDLDDSTTQSEGEDWTRSVVLTR